MSEKMLTGYRVVEYSAMSTGAMFASRFLADYGAEVIKVEIPNDPDDDSRKLPPIVNGVSATYANLNSGKKSVLLDFRTPEGHEMLMKLLKTADIFIAAEPMKYLAAKGIDYDTVKAANPNIIYGTLTCYGQTGPYKDIKGNDLVSQAFTASMTITNYKDSLPMKMGYNVGGYFGAINLVVGLIGSLYKRNETGKGQMVDVAMTDSIIASMCTLTAHYYVNGRMPTPGQSLAGVNDDPTKERIGARGLYLAKDGYVCISANQEHLLRKIHAYLGVPNLLDTPEFQQEMKDTSVTTAINRHLTEWTTTKSKQDIFVEISDAGAPACPVLNYKEILENDNIANKRGMFQEVDEPGIGKMKVSMVSAHMMNCPAEIAGPVELQGQSNDAVLGKLN